MSEKNRIRYVGLRLALMLALLAGATSSSGQNIDKAGLAQEMEREISKTLKQGKIPSAAVALVEGSEVVWTGAAGYSNIWARTEASPETVYLIGSTFKTMSMYALLGLMEQGRFELDDPVNDYLDNFKIQGDDPQNPVTFRHLLTHTSGLPADFGPHSVWGPTVPPPLEDYLRKSLRLKQPPMTAALYSNTAYTLVGYLVGEFSGVRFKSFMQKSIFDPLGMADTAFEPKPHMEERLAIPYVFDPKSGKHIPAVRTKANVWPAGIVYGTVLDQAKWLIANLNHGVYEGHRFISEETFQNVMRRQYDRFTGPISAGWLNETTGFGLTWWMSKREGDSLFAHSGSVSGYTAFIVGNLDRKTGFAILTNGNRSHKHLFELATKALDLLEAHLN